MQIAIVADTHMPRGRRAIPPRCRELMRESDLILHAGDLVSEEVLREIQAIGPPVEAVSGNMDSAALQRLLPDRTIVEVDGDYGTVTYLRNPFANEPDFAASSVNYEIKKLMASAEFAV